MLLCRTDRFLAKEMKSKIALFCNVEERAVITAKDVASIYEVPLVLSHEGVDTLVLKYLHLQASEHDLKQWEEIVHRIYNPKDEVNIGIVGKYVEYEDSYKSLKEALVHGSSDRKSTRLNSSHLGISYAVFCLKKKKTYTKWYSSNHTNDDCI